MSSIPRNSEIAFSSCLCGSCVPQMKRTEASPLPHLSRALCAARTTSGWFASPR